MTERKEKHKQKQKERGITLIALVITIIVLLILAGVALAALTGDSGILNNAESAKDKTNLANAKEQVALAAQGALTKGYAQGNGTITKENLEKELDNIVGVYTLSGDEAPWTVTIGDYKVQVSTNGSILEVGDPDDDSLTVADLVAGDYIDYIDKNGNTIECAVLYDSSSGYGVQIIALEPVEQITLGGETIEEAIESYNNAITTLNTAAAEGYLNETYATSARCVGSVPDNPNYESKTYFTSDITYFQDISGLIEDADDNYRTDFEQMKKLRITPNSTDYFLASRFINDGSYSENELGFGMRGLWWNSIGPVPCSAYLVSNNWGGANAELLTGDVIPVFTLKSNVKITGEGTEKLPYQFK